MQLDPSKFVAEGFNIRTTFLLLPAYSEVLPPRCGHQFLFKPKRSGLNIPLVFGCYGYSELSQP